MTEVSYHHTVEDEGTFGPQDIVRHIEYLADGIRSGRITSAILMIASNVADRLWPYGHPKEISGVVVCVIGPGKFKTLELNVR